MKKENRLYASDSFEVAIARVVFIKWMRKNGKWGKYMEYMRSKMNSPKGKEFYEASWLTPRNSIAFLGMNSFDYHGAYIPWRDFCKTKLDPAIEEIVEEFVF